jgi:hypothetical protein
MAGLERGIDSCHPEEDLLSFLIGVVVGCPLSAMHDSCPGVQVFEPAFLDGGARAPEERSRLGRRPTRRVCLDRSSAARDHDCRKSGPKNWKPSTGGPSSNLKGGSSPAPSAGEPGGGPRAVARWRQPWSVAVRRGGAKRSAERRSTGAPGALPGALEGAEAREGSDRNPRRAPARGDEGESPAGSAGHASMESQSGQRSLCAVPSFSRGQSAARKAPLPLRTPGSAVRSAPPPDLEPVRQSAWRRISTARGSPTTGRSLLQEKKL